MSSSEQANVLKRGGSFPAALIFDMDGLMLDTERPSIALWLEAAREYGWTIDEAVPLATIGLDEAATRATVMEACGPVFPYEEVRSRLIELYERHVEEKGIIKRPGLLKLLDHARSAGLPLAVATSTARIEAEERLERAGIREYFSALACGDEVGRGKPAPDIFLLASERLNIAPECCLGFEDSAPGLKGLAAAGIKSIFIKDMLEAPTEVLATVWRRYSDLSEAIAALQ
ncbi:HAD family hydrolase [Treponema sp.]